MLDSHTFQSVLSDSGKISPIIVLMILAASLWLVYETFQPSLYDPDSTPRVVTPRGDLSGDEQATIFGDFAFPEPVEHLNL